MSVSVIVLPILILSVLALSVLGYFICYKIMINRRMKQQESGAHVPMASTESVMKVVAVIGVVVIYCSLNSKIMNLQSELQNTTNRLHDEIWELRYTLEEMQQAAKKEAAVINTVFYDFGEIDTKEHTVEMKFRVVPNKYSAETEMSLNYRGQTIMFTNNGDGSFTGSAVFPMFDEVYEDGLFCITEGGVTKTERWEDTVWGALKDSCLPEFYIAESSFRYERGWGKKKDTVTVKGDIYIMSEEETASSFQNLKLLVKKGNTVIEEVPVQSGSLKLERTYSVEQGERLEFWLTGEDKYGYVHERNLSGWRLDGAASGASYEVEAIESDRITVPDGTEP